MRVWGKTMSIILFLATSDLERTGLIWGQHLFRTISRNFRQYHTAFGDSGIPVINTYTVTSRDINFCYPGRVPLTQFAHIAKKNLGMWA